MLSYDELLGHVKQLTTEEQLALIEATAQMVIEDLHTQKVQELVNNNHPGRIANLKPIEELQGSLNPQGRTYTDEELEDLKYSYLAEKYGLK